MTELVAGFADEAGLRAALLALRGGGFGALETYTPGEFVAPGAGSPLPRIILVAGLVGAVGGFALQVWSDVFDYPVNVGGRPAFSWPAFVPIAFELGVLCAVAAGVFGYFLVNRMPVLWAPIDECAAIRGVTAGRWCVALRLADDASLARARAALRPLQPEVVEVFDPEAAA